MAVNNFKPFGIGASANVTTQADYEALAALSTGFQAGTASSAQVNKALRQGSVMASVLAQFIANSSGVDVLDNGDVATPLANLLLGLKANTAGSFLQTANNFVEIKNAGAVALAQALANLGLGNSATRAVGTIAGTVAAGDDSRFSSALKIANNLSEIAAAGSSAVAAALANLGLGSAAQRAVGVGTNQIPDMSSFILTAMASGANPGGLKLPTGHIIQWGGGATINGAFTQNYAVPFPNAILALIPSVYATIGNVAIPTVNSSSRTVAAMNVVNASGSGVNSISVGFLAIGY